MKTLGKLNLNPDRILKDKDLLKFSGAGPAGVLQTIIKRTLDHVGLMILIVVCIAAKHF